MGQQDFVVTVILAKHNAIMERKQTITCQNWSSCGPILACLDPGSTLKLSHKEYLQDPSSGLAMSVHSLALSYRSCPLCSAMHLAPFCRGSADWCWPDDLAVTSDLVTYHYTQQPGYRPAPTSHGRGTGYACGSGTASWRSGYVVELTHSPLPPWAPQTGCWQDLWCH